MGASDSLTIVWASMDLSTGAYETEVRYNLDSNVRFLRVDIDEDSTFLTDYDGSGLHYRTFFRPDSLSIDNFWMSFTQITVN